MPDTPPIDPIERPDSRPRGVPYCGDCGYDLTGVTESSKCPECGGALVDVLMRPALELKGGKRYRSKARIMGMPAIDIAIGPHGDDPVGRARGFIAIGTDARGMVALGGRAVGVVAAGGMAIGGFTMGGMSLGAISAMGGMAIGGLAQGGWGMGILAQGGGASGVIAQGGMAIGWIVRGGGGFGTHRISPGGNDSPLATSVFDTLAYPFGGLPFDPSMLFASLGGTVLVHLAIAAILAFFAVRAIGREGKTFPTRA